MPQHVPEKGSAKGGLAASGGLMGATFLTWLLWRHQMEQSEGATSHSMAVAFIPHRQPQAPKGQDEEEGYGTGRQNGEML